MFHTWRRQPWPDSLLGAPRVTIRRSLSADAEVPRGETQHHGRDMEGLEVPSQGPGAGRIGRQAVRPKGTWAANGSSHPAVLWIRRTEGDAD